MTVLAYILLFVAFLAGIGAEAAAVRIAAWWTLTSQRRRDRKLLKGATNLSSLIEPPGGPVSQAVTLLQSRPFVIEVSPFQDREQTGMLIRRLMCELRAEDRRRYFPGDPNGGVN
jgi:hypothetical protein